MAEENKDLNEDKENPENQSNSEETTPKSTEDLKNTEDKETPEQIAEKLLKDGTPADKDIKVNKKTFDERFFYSHIFS